MKTKSANGLHRQPGLGRLQDLIGGMMNVYLNDRDNDRDNNRADKLIPMMDEAWEIVVRLRSQQQGARR